MAFGPSKLEKSATAGQQDVAKTATNNSTAAFGAGSDLMKLGGDNTNQGLDFFRTLLNGNQANATSIFAPQIQQSRDATHALIQSLSTLMPRGGGRTAALFGAPMKTAADITGLFGGLRANAAKPLIDAGLAQTNAGTNLFNTGNAALNTASGANQNVFNNAFMNRQYSNDMWGKVGSGIFGLATLPFGGASQSLLQRL